ESHLEKVRKNYFRTGISFDGEFRLAFLEQEINGNAMIRDKKGAPLALDDQNINNYLRYNQRDQIPFSKALYQNKNVYIFETKGFIDDQEQIFRLKKGHLTNGIRQVDDQVSEYQQLIHDSTHFLARQLDEEGRFAYGY